ncbi:MAG: ABC transporter substrate-binding protein [Pseudomonadota bacterium]
MNIKLLPRGVVLSGLIAAGLLAAPGAAFAGKADDTLNLAFDRELESLDNYFNTAREGIIVSRLVWDGLLYRNPETFAYEPNLATAWEYVDDTTLDLTLREGVTFHNGEPFDADDVVYTLNWVADPENGVKTQRNVSWIEGAEKLGDFKVRLKMKAPFPAALEYLSGPVVMYPNEYYAEAGPEGMGVKPVGTGPYKVTEVEPGRRFVFELNENYYDGSPKGKPSIGKLVVRTIQDSNTRLAELLSGGLDWIWRVPVDQAERLASRDQFSLVNAASMRIGYIYMDAAGRTGENPFQNKLVRQAVAHAINRQGIVDALLKGESEVVHSACFPTQVGCTQDVTKYEYNPEKAKELMAEAGYADGFTMKFSAYRERPFAEAMISNLNAIGITTEFEYLKYAALRDKIRAGEVPMGFMTWGSYSINDVSAITSNFFKLSSDDYAQDEEVRDLLEKGDTNIDTSVREAAYSAALSKIADEAYWLPLFSYNIWYAFTKDLEFTPTQDEIPRFFTAKWK